MSNRTRNIRQCLLFLHIIIMSEWAINPEDIQPIQFQQRRNQGYALASSGLPPSDVTACNPWRLLGMSCPSTIQPEPSHPVTATSGYQWSFWRIILTMMQCKSRRTGGVQTVNPYFFSTGIKHVIHRWDKRLNWSGNYRKKYWVCPLLPVVLDVYVKVIIIIHLLMIMNRPHITPEQIIQPFLDYYFDFFTHPACYCKYCWSCWSCIHPNVRYSSDIASNITTTNHQYK